MLLLIVMPSLLITVFQMNSIDQQEQAFEEIYKRQLTSVIFSINMYADDVVNRWVAEVSDQVDDLDGINNFDLKALTNQQNLIVGVLLQHFKGDSIHEKKYKLGDIPDELAKQVVDSCTANLKNIERLFIYLESNYRKVMVFEAKGVRSKHALVFALKNHKGENLIGAILVDSESFVQDVLAPRIQSVALQDVAIGLKERGSENIIYSNTKDITYTSDDINETFWQLPSYALYLKPLGDSTDAILEKRSRNNLFILAIVDFVLLLGGVLTYFNIKKQLQLAKIKSDFVSNVSHEIRTPLALISMYAESLQLNRVKGEDKLQRSYGIIFREANRLTGIVNNILNFSKMESGKRKYTFDTFNLNNNVIAVADRYGDSIKNTNVEFIMTLNEELDNVWGDKEAIDEAIANLIENAIKYGKGDKKVELATGLIDNMCWVEVKDNGIGIPAKEQKLIFKQFYRVTLGNLAHQAKGSGLGLNIVKQIVDAHKGKIVVDSEVGKGSRFRIYLPLPNNN
ncbi:sensor histidine kinase [Labilibacter marinus]|uniref:sensor histidine kinase n=1 Tax=Labilibacter marinus TaxID=1477105 RepID=UPI00094FD6CB|nr:HAMP domain-containing sensor histidine kinase [Labilibacter marinus]